MPYFENEAAIGMVPYIQSGEAIPKRHAGTIPKRPHFVFCILANNPCILSFAKTDTSEPIMFPKKMMQYRKDDLERITSDEGCQLGMNRSIQVEGSFGDL